MESLALITGTNCKNPIPLFVITHMFPTTQELKVEKALDILEKYSMIKVEPDCQTIESNSVVCVTVQKRVSRVVWDKLVKWRRIPELLNTFLDKINFLLEEDKHKLKTMTSETRQVYFKMMDVALEKVPLLSPHEEDFLELFLPFKIQLAAHLLQSGDEGKSTFLLRTALETLKQEFDGGRREMQNWAGVLLQAGTAIANRGSSSLNTDELIEKPRKFLQIVNELSAQVFGPNHPFTLLSLQNMATKMWKQPQNANKIDRTLKTASDWDEATAI